LGFGCAGARSEFAGRLVVVHWLDSCFARRAHRAAALRGPGPAPVRLPSTPTGRRPSAGPKSLPVSWCPSALAASGCRKRAGCTVERFLFLPWPETPVEAAAVEDAAIRGHPCRSALTAPPTPAARGRPHTRMLDLLIDAGLDAPFSFPAAQWHLRCLRIAPAHQRPRWKMDGAHEVAGGRTTPGRGIQSSASRPRPDPPG